MRAIKAAISIFCYNFVFTALCAVALCLATERLVTGTFARSLYLSSFTFFGTLFVYNVAYLGNRTSWPPGAVVVHNGSKKAYLFFTIMGLAGLLWSALYLPKIIIRIALPFGLLALAYSLPLLPFQNFKRLRDRGIIKIVVLTGVWTVVTAVLPILYFHISVTSYPFELLIRFCFVFALCIIFEQRDAAIDAEGNLKTIAVILGRNGTLIALILFVALFLFFSWLQFSRTGSLQRLEAAILAGISTIISARYLNRHKPGMKHIFLGDGMMLLYATLVII